MKINLNDFFAVILLIANIVVNIIYINYSAICGWSVALIWFTIYKLDKNE